MVNRTFARAALTLAGAALMLLPESGAGQWRNRYPHVAGYGHHVYLEGYELPLLTSGPIDPAPSPDARQVAFSARGWIWLLDLGTGSARRLTTGPGMDSRPAWHPSGDRLAFVRDNDHDTRIVVVNAASGDEVRTIDTPTIELDPAFSPDGEALYYTSGQAGTLDIWALDLATGESQPVTADPGIELKPQPLANGDFLMLAKRGGDRVELRSPSGGDPRVLVSGNIASMARPALAPDGTTFALNWPSEKGWDLRLHDLSQPGASVLLASGGLPLTPAWSADGEWIYYSGADDAEVMRLKRVRAAGGPSQAVEIRAWEWTTGTARLRIRTMLMPGADRASADGLRRFALPSSSADLLTPARLNVLGPTGHPAVPDEGGIHFDGANGRVFFYSPGLIEVTVPAGEVTVSAVQGLATPEATATVTAAPGSVTDVVLRLAPVWDARSAGWASGDHHFHLNYGGPYDLHPADLVPKMEGEALDIATPLLANLHNRYEDQDLWGWEKSSAPPFIRFGQEIRSHFLGHMGLIEIPGFHWPWVWGPGYEVYGTDDRTNAEVLEYAHSHGGMGYYVHPVSVPDPFSEEGRPRVPVELVADAVMGDVDALEVMCLWSSFEGTAALWHRFLNLGITTAPSAGTDVMLNLYRTMAVGTTRVYVHTAGNLNWPAYLEGLRAGRSFVTNGPFLDLRVDGARPGGVVEPGTATWTLDLATATSVDTVDVIVNGRVVVSHPAIASPGHRTYTGDLDLPQGGWIAARARGGETRWPSMDTSPFAHTAPVWIGSRGSTDPATRREAATELRDILTASLARLRTGYLGTDIPRLEARFAAAMARLDSLATPAPNEPAPDSPARSAMGFPPTVQLERVVPVRLEPEELPQLLDLIRNELARQGIVQEVLGGFEWRARSVMGGRYVSIRSEGDATRIRVLGNYRDGLLTFAFGPGPMLAIGGAMLAAGLGAPTPLAIVPAALLGWASTLLPWRHLFGRESRSLHRLLGAIEQQLKELS